MAYIDPLIEAIDLHVSPTVADGMVFVASNKDEYYGVNAATGEVVWTFVTARGHRKCRRILGCVSMAYHEGKLYIVDMFFITALDQKPEKLSGRVGKERNCILHQRMLMAKSMLQQTGD